MVKSLIGFAKKGFSTEEIKLFLYNQGYDLGLEEVEECVLYLKEDGVI